MIACGEKKHPGGKMVRVCVRATEEGLVEGVLLSGDFFAEPAEEFEKVLEELRGLRVGLGEVVERVLEALRARDVRLYGVTLDDVREALERALEMVKPVS